MKARTEVRMDSARQARAGDVALVQTSHCQFRLLAVSKVHAKALELSDLTAIRLIDSHEFGRSSDDPDGVDLVATFDPSCLAPFADLYQPRDRASISRLSERDWGLIVQAMDQVISEDQPGDNTERAGAQVAMLSAKGAFDALAAMLTRAAELEQTNYYNDLELEEPTLSDQQARLRADYLRLAEVLGKKRSAE